MPHMMDQDRQEIIRAEMEWAQHILATEPSSLVLVCTSHIHQRSGRGIAPLYELVTESEPQQLKGGVLADKIVGKAAALLALYAGFSAVYADIMSTPAYDLLVQNNVLVAAGLVVDHILNRTKSGFCPMELLTADVTEPEEAYSIIGRQLQQWQLNNLT